MTAAPRRGPVALAVATIITGCYSAAGAAAELIPGLDGGGRLLLTGVIAGAGAGIAAWFVAPHLRAPSAPTAPTAPTAPFTPADAAASPPPPLLPDPPVGEVATHVLEAGPGVHDDARRLATRLRFDRQLDRALEGADDEPAAFAVAGRALEAIPPLARTELLVARGVADTPTTPVMQVAEVGPDGEGPGCPVAALGDCPAIRRARTLRFESTDALDACAHLRERLTDPCSAVCVPIRVLGRPIGVVHRTGPVDAPPDDVEIGYLESLATKLETRLSLLRAVSPSTLPTLDPVTGMFTREAVEAKIFELARSLTPFALAQCDVDHFGDYVTANGDEAGRKALRKVAQAMMSVLRPTDIVGRCGIDELLVVFPNTAAGDASGALERVREHLALGLALDGNAPFTCSFGIVDSGFGRSLDELLVEADVATSLAKDLGRNRVVVAGELVSDPLYDED